MSEGIVLIVDDNKDVLSALEILLDDEFTELITLSNPNQILNIIQTKHPDVILLDMNFTAGVNKPEGVINSKNSWFD